MIQSYLRPRVYQQRGSHTEFCPRCGLSHAALNVEITDRMLVRKVRGPKHRLKAYGGAFGFSAPFWDAHANEIDELIIKDEESGEVFRGNAAVFAQAHRQTFSPIFGQQLVIPLHALERFADDAEFQFWRQ